MAQFYFTTRDMNPLRSVYAAYAFDSKYGDECRSSPGWAAGPSFPVATQDAVKPKGRSWVGKLFESNEGVYINANQIPSGILRQALLFWLYNFAIVAYPPCRRIARARPRNRSRPLERRVGPDVDPYCTAT